MTDPGARQGLRPIDVVQGQNLVQLYTEVCAGVRNTDEISFKLLGFVPVVSGAGAAALTFLLETRAISLIPIALLAGLGALSTLGVYRWERRNIQTCERMRARAKILEKDLGFGACAGLPPAQPFLGRRYGKTESIRLIYGAALAAWAVPVVAELVPGRV